MKTFKPSGAELQELTQASRSLKNAQASIGPLNKTIEAAKAKLCQWLEEKRGLKFAELATGEIIEIEEVALIEISSMKKFKELELLTDHPEVHAKYMGQIPVRRFKPLVA